MVGGPCGAMSTAEGAWLLWQVSGQVGHACTGGAGLGSVRLHGEMKVRVRTSRGLPYMVC